MPENLCNRYQDTTQAPFIIKAKLRVKELPDIHRGHAVAGTQRFSGRLSACQFLQEPGGSERPHCSWLEIKP